MAEIRKQAQHFAEGDMVLCPDGSVGLLINLAIEPHQCAVQFGASGPVRYFTWRRLQRATGQEIIEAGLLGVGCTADQARDAAAYARRRKRNG